MAVTPDSTDAELLTAHADGDAHAFNELVRRHRDRLWAVALRTLREPEEAADALQEALINAFRSAHTYRGEAAVTTWLHRIVVNACLNRIRRAAVRPTVSLESETIPEPQEPTDEMASRETRMAIEEALSTLPADQRAAVVLVDVEGYSIAEAARLLEIAEGTVKSRCARGRAKLAKILGYLRNPDAIANVPPQNQSTNPLSRSRQQITRGEGSK
jgi:RNA polymerase sigma-70 factor (ECF subfamily)